MEKNITEHYREIAQDIVRKLILSVTSTIEQKKMPDLYWKLEQAIVDALKEADRNGVNRTTEKMAVIMKEFDLDNGTSES